MSMGARYPLGRPINARGPAEASPLKVNRSRGSDRADVDRLRSLVAGLGLVLHARALGERAVAIGLDAAVVDEEVLAAFIGSDEAEALLVAEPLNGALCHVFPPRRLSCCVCRGSSKATVCERLHCFRRTRARPKLRAPYHGRGMRCQLASKRSVGAEAPLVRFGQWQNMTPPSSVPGPPASRQQQCSASAASTWSRSTAPRAWARAGAVTTTGSTSIPCAGSRTCPACASRARTAA